MLPFCVQELSLGKLHSPSGCRGTAQGFISHGSAVWRSTSGNAGMKTAACIALILVSLVITKPRDEPLLEEPFCCDWWRKQASGGVREKRLNWTKGLDWNLKNASFITPCFTLNKSLISLIWHWLTSNKNEFSSSLVPFCLAPVSLHTCWSLAEQSQPLSLPAGVAAAVWPCSWRWRRSLGSAAAWTIYRCHPSVPSLASGSHGLSPVLLASLPSLVLFPRWTSLHRWSFCSAGSEWFLRVFGISELLRQRVGVHLMSACFPAGLCLWPALICPHCFHPFAFQHPFLAKAYQAITEIMSVTLPSAAEELRDCFFSPVQHGRLFPASLFALLCCEQWTTKHLFAPSKDHLFIFFKQFLSWVSLKLKASTNIKEKLFISFWRKSWTSSWMPISSRVLPSDLPFSFNSALGLPYLEAVLILSSAPTPSSSLLPSHHTLLSQGIFGRIGRNYSKNRIFTSQTVACHLVPSWFTGGFEFPRLATQEATASGASMTELNVTAEFGMWQHETSPFCTVVPWRQASYPAESWKLWLTSALMELNRCHDQPKVALLFSVFD